MTTLIITAAGKASRFHDVGYDQPKYLLPWINSKSILHNIINELNSTNLIEYVLVLANNREIYFKDKIEQELPNNIDSKVLFVRDTMGQAHTTLLGTEEIMKSGLGNKSIIVHNSDTILMNRDISKLTKFNDEENLIGYIDTFQSNNNKYSYVLESNGILKKFLEKETISPMASSGLISFNSAKHFFNIYSKYIEKIDNSTESYISKIIDCSIQSGDLYRINYNPIISDTIVLGTPEEYCTAYTVNSAGIKGT